MKKNKRKFAISASITSIVLLSTGINYFNYSVDVSTPYEDIGYVHFIDVGQADAILIDYLDYEILIDGGNNGDGDLVSDYLSDKVDGNLEIIVATHPHEDHIGGLDTILEDYNVETIIDSGETHTTKTYKEYMLAVTNEKDATLMHDDDSMFVIAENIFFTVIELEDGQSNLNDNSVICRLDVGEISFLFTGDLEAETEINHLDKFEEVDVLKVGHHGSDTSTSREFIDGIKPQYAIISCGVNNRYGHPKESTTLLLDEKNIITYRTDTQGTIVGATDGSTINFITSK